MDKRKYVLRNIIKSIIWLFLILVIFVLGKKYINVNYINWLEPVYENSLLILSIFITSEIIVGIIPPELFIVWAMRNNNLTEFILLVAIMSVISYLAGLIGFLIGRYLNRTRFYRFIKWRFLRNLDRRLNVFGLYLIILAAMTPIPFSGVSMLVGSVRYSIRKYLLFSLFRFGRFALYGIIFWETNIF